jgi:hypothetical protein
MVVELSLFDSRPKMHYAALDSSPRLQRLYALLSDGQEHTTFDIISRARICAVNSAVSELRRNGKAIKCWQDGVTPDGASVYKYQMEIINQ